MSEKMKQCKKCNTSEKIYDFYNNPKYNDFINFWNGFLCYGELKTFCKNETYNKDFENNICPFCKHELIDTMLTRDDFKAIGKASNYNRDFLLAMIELRKKDVIEFETKMRPFRQGQNEKKVEQVTNSVVENNIPKCPTCGSADLRKISTTSKVMNTVMWGIFGTKRHKTYHCNSCGYER